MEDRILLFAEKLRELDVIMLNDARKTQSKKTTATENGKELAKENEEKKIDSWKSG